LITDAIIFGAEIIKADIPQKDKLHQGSAATLYRREIKCNWTNFPNAMCNTFCSDKIPVTRI